MSDVEKVIRQIDWEINVARMVNKDYTTVDLSLLEDALRAIKTLQQKYFTLEHDWRMVREHLKLDCN